MFGHQPLRATRGPALCGHPTRWPQGLRFPSLDCPSVVPSGFAAVLRTIHTARHLGA